jgi:hypothetical protein
MIAASIRHKKKERSREEKGRQKYNWTEIQKDRRDTRVKGSSKREQGKTPLGKGKSDR